MDFGVLDGCLRDRDSGLVAVNSLRSGAAMEAKCHTNRRWNPHKPNHLSSSLNEVGRGYSVLARVFSGFCLTPSLLTIKPKYSISGLAKIHFEALSETLADSSLDRIRRK